MDESGRKHCLVAYATPARQYLWPVELPAEATIGDAIEAARRMVNDPDVPWESAPVGIFGEVRARGDRLRDGDRVELYRLLRIDPRARRRERVQRLRKGKEP